MAGPEDGYFNDLSQQPPAQNTSQSQAGPAAGSTSQNEDDNSYVPRPKRIACVVCRKRKLRCDGKKPSCGTCSRLGHNCAYDEVETLLRNQEREASRNPTTQQPQQPEQNNTYTTPIPSDPFQGIPDLSSLSNNLNSHNAPLGASFEQTQQSQAGFPATDLGLDGDFSWEMISLGLEEPLPPKDVTDELNDIYFKKIHPSIPMIHRPRYYAAMDLAPNMRPPVCLRYIMWCLAASITPKYSFLQEHFYARARKYIEMDEMKGHGENIVSVAHCQCWLLIALYEFKQMFFPRAWISTGRAGRLASMMSLNRLDGVGLDVKQSIPPPRDWTEREERRRTFWMAFCEDRYASIGTGWPMTFDERDIMTNLPSSEEAFISGKPEQTMTLSEVMAGEGIQSLSPLAGVVMMACLFGRNLMHLHRPDPQDKEHDLNGEFWKRHRAYDNILLNISLSLPSHLRLPNGIGDPNTVFCNMSIHTSTICLHQAAIFKAEKNRIQNQIAAESKRRCIIAADQIASIMKMVSHTDLSVMNPFSAFCLYVAARVFVQYLKSRPEDQTVRSSLQFLLTALNALKSYSTLTESFLIQLDVDLSGTDLAADFAKSLNPCRDKRMQQSSGVGTENPLQGTNALNITGSPYSQGGSQTFGSLPSRQKQSESQRSSSNSGHSRACCHPQGLNSSSGNPSPRTDENGLWTGLDMDISPDISAGDQQVSGSDKASPATMNSSSNTTFTPPAPDRPFPHTQSQHTNTGDSHQHPSKPVTNANLALFSQTPDDLPA
ncbi:C6 transcription factor Prf, partial [Rasamsonia emersonii CBS 393.64]